MVDEAKIKTNFLKPTHLIDHDTKMLLGMVWAIILDFAIKGISEDDTTAKEGLLLWCRKKTAGYRDVDPPSIQNFTGHWRNGLAFCALIHKHQVSTVDCNGHGMCGCVFPCCCGLCLVTQLLPFVPACVLCCFC